MVRDEGDDAALGGTHGQEPDGAAPRPRAGSKSRSYFFRTNLDESGSGSAPALPLGDVDEDEDGYTSELDDVEDDLEAQEALDPQETIFPDDDASPMPEGMNGVDPNLTIRHGMRFVIPQGEAPLREEIPAAPAPPLRPRRIEPASDEAPLPSLEQLEELSQGEPNDWGEPIDQVDEEDDELITELGPRSSPTVLRTSDEPPYDGPRELTDDMEAACSEMAAARAALDRATAPFRVSPEAPPPPPADPAPAPARAVAPAPIETATRATARLTPKLDGLTFVGGDADAQKRVRDAISRAAERVAGADGAVTWRVPMGALVEALRESVPDARGQELARLEEELAEARGVIDEARSRAAKLERDLAESRGRTARIEGGTSRLERERDDARSRLALLEREQADAQARAARLDEALARARERAEELERANVALRERLGGAERDRDTAREAGERLVSDLALARQEIEGLEAEAARAKDQAAQVEADLLETRARLAQLEQERDEVDERARHSEARLAAEERVVSQTRGERDHAREELAAVRRELGEVRATAAQEIATLAREYGEELRALEARLDATRRERSQQDELLIALLGSLPDDAVNPLVRDGKPHQVLEALRRIVARLARLEGDRRRAALLPVPPFPSALERLGALPAPGHERLEARCLAGQARYLELRDLLQRRQGGTQHLLELGALVREAIVLEELAEVFATAP